MQTIIRHALTVFALAVLTGCGPSMHQYVFPAPAVIAVQSPYFVSEVIRQPTSNGTILYFDWNGPARLDEIALEVRIECDGRSGLFSPVWLSNMRMQVIIPWDDGSTNCAADFQPSTPEPQPVRVPARYRFDLSSRPY